MAKTIKEFSRFIAELEDGCFNAECSNELQDVLETLDNLSDQSGVKTSTAKITVEITLTFDSGNIITTAAVKTKTPAKPRGKTIFWLSENGDGVCRENPKQSALPFAVLGTKPEVVNFEERKPQERVDING